MRPPPVQFVAVGGEHVAYQVVGDGPVPGLALTSWINGIDGQWEDPEHLRIWRTILAADGRAIHLDHRGLGSSDPVPPDRMGDLDEWVDDVVAVLDAVGVERTSMLAEGEQAAVAIRLAARHPERVDRIVFTYPSMRRPALYDDLLPLVEQHWGTGPCLQALGRPGEIDFLARCERRAATRAAAAGLIRSMAAWDVSDDVASVEAECLVMSVVGAPEPEQAASLAGGLPRATLVEVRPVGNYWGDRMFEQILEWVGWRPATGERRLSSLLLTDVVGSTSRLAKEGDRAWRQTLDFLDELVADRATRHGGRVLKHTGDGHLLTFDRPGAAVAAGLEIAEGARRLDVALRAGVHTGEIELRDNEEVGGMTVHLVARIAAAADAGELLVSRTVKDLLGGAGHDFDERGEHELRGVPGTWQLFAVR